MNNNPPILHIDWCITVPVINSAKSFIIKKCKIACNPWQWLCRSPWVKQRWQTVHTCGPMIPISHAEQKSQSPNSVSERAAKMGDLSRLELMQAGGFSTSFLAQAFSEMNRPTSEICTAAASRGHLHVLQWARRVGLPLDQHTFKAAFDANEEHPEYSLRHR